MMSEHREWRRGDHYVRFEPPNILWMKGGRHTSLEDAKWIVSFCQEFGSRHPFMVVTDVSECVDLDPEARRYVSENFVSERLMVVVYIGARLIHKAVAKGIALVQKVLLGRDVTPVYFVANEQEARYLLEQLRHSSPQQPSL